MNEDIVVLVTRGDEMPKKNFETKLHPTYNTAISLRENGVWGKPLTVVHFFEHYRALSSTLAKLSTRTDEEAPFPPTKRSSMLGIKIAEAALQERCFMLNQWMQSLFKNFENFSPEAQDAIWQFMGHMEPTSKESAECKQRIIEM